MPWKCPALKATQYLFLNHFVFSFLSSTWFLFCYRNIISELCKKVIDRKDICKVLIRHNFQLIAQTDSARGVQKKIGGSWLELQRRLCQHIWAAKKTVAAYLGCEDTLWKRKGPKTPAWREFTLRWIPFLYE